MSSPLLGSGGKTKTDRVSSRGTICSKKLAEMTKSNASDIFSNSFLEEKDVDTGEPNSNKNTVSIANAKFRSDLNRI